MTLTRRQFLSVAAGAATAAGLGAYGAVIEPNRVCLRRIEVALPRLAPAFDGVKIAHISDLHHGPFTGDHEIGAVVRSINRLNPDLVVITGDFVTSQWPVDDRIAVTHIHPCAALLADLRAPLGVFAVLGNHDLILGPDLISEALSVRRTRVLRNQSVAITRDQHRLWLAGLDDALRGKPRLDLALQAVPAGEPIVLLVHEPDYADQVSRAPVDLQLSGHSHGGQVRIPLVGPPYLPLLARKYPSGRYRVGPLTLYANNGIGVIEVPVRFDCPPELTLLTLKARPT